MPYIRIDWHDIVWAREYQENPTGLPRIIELSLLLFLIVQMIKKRLTINAVTNLIRRDRIFRVFILITVYILLQPFLLEMFSFPMGPAAKGIVRGSLIMPLIAYAIGSTIELREKHINIFFVGLMIAGILQTIAMLNPSLFPDYMMIYRSEQVSPLWVFQGPLSPVSRQAGFWDLSTQAATFISIIICLQIVAFLHSRSKKLKLVLLPLIALSLIALSVSQQRIQFIAISIIFIIIFLAKVSRKYPLHKQIFFKMVIFSLFITINFVYPYIFLSTRMDALYTTFYQDYRVEIVWPAYIEFIFQEPSVLVFGAGFGSDALDEFNNPMHLAHAHNQVLGWVSGLGLFVAISFVYLFIHIYKRVRITKSSPFLNEHERMISFFGYLMTITIFFICLAESPLQQEPVAILVFFVAGISSSLYKRHMNIKNNISKAIV